MKDLDLKYKSFARIIKSWNQATEGICSLSNACNLEDEAEEEIENIRHQIDDIMLTAVKKLMEIPVEDTTIYDDEWFWAEWDTSIECFYYVYGKTQFVRCDRNMQPDKERLNLREGDFLNITPGKAKPIVNIISSSYAIEFFSNNFNEEDYTKVMMLNSGQFYETDEEGIFIFKG